MAHSAPLFEIHVHGEVSLHADVKVADVQEALKPLWQYAGARSLAEGAISHYEEEPGLQFDQRQHLLRMCWAVRGDEDFRRNGDDMWRDLDELGSTGAPSRASMWAVSVGGSASAPATSARAHASGGAPGETSVAS